MNTQNTQNTQIALESHEIPVWKAKSSCFGGPADIIHKDMTAKVVIVTGSNTGIGKETVRELARMGATVIMACRDSKKTLPVLEKLKSSTHNSNIVFIRLDLAELKSIQEFAEEFKSKYNRLDVLINNAGIMALPERKLTKDGFEMQFGTNHIGHFYLTTLLLDTLKQSAPSRILNLSSKLSAKGTMVWDDLNAERKYDMIAAYNNSKLANIIFTKELQRRLEGSNVKAVAVHPGVVNTDIARYAGEKWYYNVLLKVLALPIYLCTLTPEEGAHNSLFCALKDYEKLKGGAYYIEFKVAKENPEALIEDNWKKLWDLTEQMIASKLAK